MEKRTFLRFHLVFFPILLTLFVAVLFPPNLSSAMLENASLVELSENPTEEEQTEKFEIDDFLFDVDSAEMASQKAQMSRLSLFCNWNRPIVDIDLPPPELCISVS